MTMYKLLKTQQNNLKKQISVIINQEIARTTQKNQVIYEIKYLKEILQNTHQEKQKMKNSFQNKI